MTFLQVGAFVGGAPVTLFAASGFSNTITTGSIFVAVIVLATAAFFTVRSNVASTWKDNYDASEVRRHQAEDALKTERDEWAVEREQQRELRHDLKNQLAALAAQLEIEKAKPDLTAIVNMATEHYTTAMREVTLMFDGVTRTQAQMLVALEKLADR